MAGEAWDAIRYRDEAWDVQMEIWIVATLNLLPYNNFWEGWGLYKKLGATPCAPRPGGH